MAKLYYYNQLKEGLTKLLQLLLQTSEVLNIWKLSNIVLIPKKPATTKIKSGGLCCVYFSVSETFFFLNSHAVLAPTPGRVCGAQTLCITSFV